MLIENPLNMRVEIQRHSPDSLLYTVRLYHPDHGNLQRAFEVYDELEQTLSGLLIAKEDSAAGENNVYERTPSGKSWRAHIHGRGFVPPRFPQENLVDQKVG